ncbi:MAG TPA: cyclase family protein, partial [Acidimicrobiales bacterium]|nr:cyclase family protein [Acidimicrobiales bacterium]
RVAAARLVRDGITVPCAFEITTQYPAGKQQRFMLKTGEAMTSPQREPHGYSESDRVGVAGEYVGICCHGIDVTHIDALSHMFFDGVMYNGKPAGLVTALDGATHHAMTALREGIVTRGILLDIPATTGIDFCPPGTAILPADLEAAEARQGVRVGRGDVLLLRTGNGHRRAPHADPSGSWRQYPGWHPACLPWLHAREVAAIGHDGPQDLVPAPYPSLHVPIHAIGIVAMGLWLIDNLDLEALAVACARLGRHEFEFVCSAMLMQGATGAPVNPLAIF